MSDVVIITLDVVFRLSFHCT